MLKTLLGLVNKGLYETTKTVERTPTPDLQRIYVHAHNGRVKVRQWEQNLIRATVVVKVTSEADAQDTDRLWRLEEADGTLTFEQISKQSGLFHGIETVDVELTVPQHLDARLISHNGLVDVAHYIGNITGHSHNGTGEFHHITGDITFTSHNGHVEVRHVEGDVDVRAHNGYIEVRDATGSVAARSHNGRIVTEGCAHALRLETHNGELSVRTKQPLTGSWNLETKHGPIHLRIPRSTSARFQLETHMGQIKGNAVPFKGSGMSQAIAFTLGEGGALVEADTKMGAIDIQFTD